jgi:threonine/homoserine/homoserine lactone efflux protein
VPFLVAIWFGEALWLLAAVLGLTAFASAFHQAFVLLKYLGAAYLLYLAYRMWVAPAAVQEGELPEQRSALALFGSGFAITIGNPKIMAFYLALLPALIDVPHVTAGGVAALVAVQQAVLVAIDLAWMMGASYARCWLRTPGAVRIANRLSAGAMGAAAVAIANR